MKMPSIINKEIIPFCIFFQLNGLHYFSANSTSFSKKIPPKFLGYFLLLSSLSVISLVSQMTVSPHAGLNESKKFAVQKTIEAVVMFGMFITSFICLLQSILSTSQHQKIFENFSKIASLSWNRSYFKIEYKDFKKYFIFKFFLLQFSLVSWASVSQ